ncbi:MAG: hypothetical protein DRJ01_01240 [Bacteroidetes bacterium]|nr:MAG: hypothetical protein DRJ01_01240 [Bacteroidota bacterium]
MFFKIFFISLIFVGIAFMALSIKLLLKKNAKFPNSSISKNKELKKRGIFCANTQDKIANREACNLCENN